MGWREEGGTHRSERRMASFCARARQREVLPVPGGPCSSTTLSLISSAVSQGGDQVAPIPSDDVKVHHRIAEKEGAVDVSQ